MIPYSLEQKLSIYRAVRKFLIDTKGDEAMLKARGFCLILAHVIRLQFHFDSYEVFKCRPQFNQSDTVEETAFPELMKYKPNLLVFSDGEPNGLFWFDIYEAGNQRRLEIMDEIIKELE
jgi:hypothetical protein